MHDVLKEENSVHSSQSIKLLTAVIVVVDNHRCWFQLIDFVRANRFEIEAQLICPDVIEINNDNCFTVFGFNPL
jgi:hypothetical protein